MKWIGQNIWSFISRFRSDVYLESISSGTIASGGNLGLDASNKIVKATEASGDLTSIVAGTGLSGTSLTGPIPTLNVDASQTQITSVGTIGTGVWNGTEIASAYLDSDTAHLTTDQTFTGRKIFSALTTFDSCNLTSATADSPILQITNTTDDDEASRLIFQKLRDDNAVASGQNLGEIFFRGQDSAQNAEDYAFIIGEIDVSTHGQESGALKLGVANHDGGNGWGLIMTGGSENNEIDVTLGLGANSVVTIPGNIDLAGDIDVDGTLETDALTIGGAAVLAQATASAVGAVELATTAEAITGTDTARAVTPAGLKARVSQIVNLKGYATLQNDVYDYANSYNLDDEAPFQLDTSYGSGTINSSTTVDQKTLFRAGGFHVPFACTVSDIQAQITCNNDGNVSVAVVEYRPNADANTDYPRIVYETVVVDSENNNNKVSSTTIATGDLDNTAVLAGSHLLIMVKGDGTSAGGTLVVSVAIGLSW